MHYENIKIAAYHQYNSRFCWSYIISRSILSGGDNLVFGITKIDALLCSGILILIAIWIQLATIYHMMLEKHGEIL